MSVPQIVRCRILKIKSPILQGGFIACLCVLFSHTVLAAPIKPAVQGRMLEQKGEWKKACRVYERDIKKNKKRALGVELRLAQCFEKAGQQNKSLALWHKILQSPELSQDVFVLRAAMPVMLPQQEFSQKVLAVNSLGSDIKRREALAEILEQLVKAGQMQEQALDTLFLRLPETIAARRLFQEKAGLDWQKKETPTIALSRAEVLAKNNRNDDVIATLSFFSPEAEDKSEEACRMRYLMATALRKQRRYQAAREMLNITINTCDGETKRNAMYLTSRLAAMDPTEAGLKFLDQFLQVYPDHAFADDVLYWKATMIEKLRGQKEADAVLADLVKRYPKGDMLPKAIFKRALMFAEQQNVEKAEEQLQVLLESDQTPAQARERAQFWRARLLLFPDLMQLKENTDIELANEGRQKLAILAHDRAASYYGFLAREMLHLDEKKPKLKPEHLKPILSSQLSEDASFQQAQSLIAGGYEQEASYFLDAIAGKYKGTDAMLSLARVYEEAGFPEKGYQVLKQAGLAYPAGVPEQNNLALWLYAYPSAYSDSVSQSAAQLNLSEPLLFGLIREESMLDAGIVSWAGAVGLCQLMPSVAKQEALHLGFKLENLDDLSQPKINVLLGASQLSRLIRQFSHPLLGIAAYNAGSASVGRWLKASMPLDTFVEMIPFEETREYVKRVTSTWLVYAYLAGKLSQVSFDLEVLPQAKTKAAISQ